MQLDNPPRLLEVDDLTPTVSPARSRLFHLEPFGIGTPRAESLTSYIGRLAYDHCLSPSLLFRWVIAHSNNAFALDAHKSRDPYVKLQSSYLWNGMGPVAASIVEIFEKLTQRRDLSLTTLLRYEDAFSSISLGRPHRAWCPICLQEGLEQDGFPYEPLSWHINSVTACLRHNVFLSTVCPSGCPSQAVLIAHSLPGHCSKCNTWLGLSAQKYHTVPVSQQDLWVAQAVEELIAERHSGASVLPMSEMIRYGTMVLFDGKLAHFAKHIGRAKSTIWTWVNTGECLALSDLLLISYAFQIHLLDLIQGRTECWNNARPISLRRKPLRPASGADWEDIKSHIQMILASHPCPVPSVMGISNHFSVSERLLRNHFPEECRAISKRYREHKLEVSELRWQQEERDIRVAMVNLMDSGIIPTARRIAQKMKKSYAIWKNQKRKAILIKLASELNIALPM